MDSFADGSRHDDDKSEASKQSVDYRVRPRRRPPRAAGTFHKRQDDESLKTGNEKPVHSRLVRERGFEPLRFNPLDPKSEK
jgi:hypothetical protein